MNITIINGTNRVGNKSMLITLELQRIVAQENHQAAVIDLENFTGLFRGTRLTLENASEKQQHDIQKIIDAHIVVYVVPTYHSGIPSPLKNFLDLLETKDIYEHKVIGVISSNDSGRDEGARQAVQILNGILAYRKASSVVVSEIPIINFDQIDVARLERFMHYCSSFVSQIQQ